MKDKKSIYKIKISKIKFIKFFIILQKNYLKNRILMRIVPEE
jgi:hypothetical protein